MEPATIGAVYSDLNIPSTSLIFAAAVMFVSLPLSAVGGFLMGRKVRNKRLESGQDIDSVIGETTLGAFLALLGLLLAFTFGNALTYFSETKVAMTEEANAIGTAFLRADVLPEQEKSEMQAALLAYAKTRVTSQGGGAPSEESAMTKLETSLRLQAALWPLAVEATAAPFPAATRSFFLSSINDVVDAHMIRIAALSLPISKFANAMMFVAALAAVFLLGNRAGMVGRALTWRTFFFTGFLFLVMLTIVDTQRATQGLVVVDQTPLKATIFDMETALQ